MTSDSPIVNWAILSPYPSPFARLPGFICFRFLAGAGAWIYLSRCHGVIWLYTRLRATCRRYNIIFCRWPSDAYYFDWATLAWHLHLRRTVYSVLRSRPHERDTVLQWPDRRRQRPVGHWSGLAPQTARVSGTPSRSRCKWRLRQNNCRLCSDVRPQEAQCSIGRTPLRHNNLASAAAFFSVLWPLA